MKKIISLILAILLCFTMLTSCGGKKTGNDDNNKKTDPDKETNTENILKGTELSTFITKYTDSKEIVWNAMSKKFEDEQNLEFSMGVLPFTFLDLMVVEIVMFDALSVKDGDTYKGKILLTDIEAWKKVKGDTIEFGYDYVYPDEKNNYKKGDREVTSGKFNIKDETVTYEHYTERDGKKIFRYVIEIMKNSDKSYSSQVYTYGDKNGGEDENKLIGYFTWFEGENIISSIADKEGENINFSYSSIYGKKNMKPEDMSKSMNVTLTTSFIDGKASYTDK